MMFPCVVFCGLVIDLFKVLLVVSTAVYDIELLVVRVVVFFFTSLHVRIFSNLYLNLFFYLYW